MKYFLHFLTSNIKYNKIELGISYSITLLFIFVFYYLQPQKLLASDGDIFFSVAFYALLYAFFSNKKKFSLKYLLSLPLSKSELILTKVTSDFIYFIPAMTLAFFGIRLNKLEFSVIPLIIILFQAVTFVAFFMFDTDIEQPRLENAKSSFLNRLIYVRKYAEMIFFGIFVIYVALAINMTPTSMAIKQYFIIILLSLSLGFKYHRTLKLMKDESLSYFKPKRDLFKIGWKVSVFAIPAIFFHIFGYQLPSRFGSNPIYSRIQYGKKVNIEKNLEFFAQNKINKSGFTPLSAVILSGRSDILDELIARNIEISDEDIISTEKYKDVSPIHLAAISGKVEILKKLLNDKNINLESKGFKNTPLNFAAMNCNLEALDYLISKGADINHQDKSGNTPLIYSSKAKCYPAMVILLESEANPFLKNDKDLDLAHYLKKSKFKYLVERLTPGKPKIQRGLAGEKK